MLVHTGEKNFACSICDKRFSLEYNMKIHERIHMGVKPHICEKCGHSFAQAANLKMHMQRHEREEEEYGTVIISRPPSLVKLPGDQQPWF